MKVLFGFLLVAIGLIQLEVPKTLSLNATADSKTSRSFSVIYKDDVIGQLQAEKIISGNKTIFRSTSHVKTTVLLIKKINVRYRYKVVLEKGEMKFADVLVRRKGEIKERVKIRKRGKTYISNSSTSPQVKSEKPITFTTTQLYFKEPIGMAKIFSEKSGKECTIKVVSDGVYQMDNENGTTNTYYYEKGILTKIEVDMGLIRFKVEADGQS